MAEIGVKGQDINVKSNHSEVIRPAHFIIDKLGTHAMVLSQNA